MLGYGEGNFVIDFKNAFDSLQDEIYYHYYLHFLISTIKKMNPLSFTFFVTCVIFCFHLSNAFSKAGSYLLHF